jgi:hypothetical protein
MGLSLGVSSAATTEEGQSSNERSPTIPIAPGQLAESQLSTGTKTLQSDQHKLQSDQLKAPSRKAGETPLEYKKSTKPEIQGIEGESKDEVHKDPIE